MQAGDDIKFMRRCLDLAVNAEGNTYPNPLVGSVIVYNGMIIGEGYHLKAGGPHAEKIAIDSVIRKDLLHFSTLYVNLEPCSHFGKTPPCSDLIIGSGIKRIVTGTTDTSGKVNGKGISMLRDAGCEVINGILEDECRRVNRRFFTYHEKKRPYIILKWAESSDGYLDIDRDRFSGRRPTWITGKSERVLVHRWRAAEQSILVGAGTIRADNPLLNVREWTGKDPVKLILSSSGCLDKNSLIFSSGGEVIVFTHVQEIWQEFPARIILLDRNISSAIQILNFLYESEIQSLFIEGGAEVLKLFINEGLWDEARIFHGRSAFGGGVKAPELKGRLCSGNEFAESILEVISNDFI